MSDNDIYCEIFVDTTIDRELIKDLVSTITGGTLGKFGEVVSKTLEINIKNNELFNSQKFGGSIPKDSDPSRPYYFKFRMDISPFSQDIAINVFIDNIQELMSNLEKQNMRLFCSPSVEHMRTWVN